MNLKKNNTISFSNKSYNILNGEIESRVFHEIPNGKNNFRTLYKY